ncbi:prohibitin family protein [Hugenholtzia roseola]|uniref:prohibitin family protein n=1 Tax=Hugenholtzia roseola TaxID=1002 RepID=UPI000420D4F7|nr:prohibitin family protein [Hugenholtzia roseola]
MKKIQTWLFYGFCSLLLIQFISACTVIRPGEVGVKQRLGKIKSGIMQPRAVFHNPFTTKVVKVPTRTINMPVVLDALPSKEGLSIRCELAVLFHIKEEAAIDVIKTVGVRNGEGIILSVLRSAAADVTSQFFAKDMHTSKRFEIEQAISAKMTEILGDRGFVVESVLLKSIRLPEKLARAIEAKLEAEQEAQTMQFVLDRERQEAERLKIEAEGIRDAQKIISEGLNDMIIKYKSIEAFRELSKSNNAKVIVTDGTTPFLID